MVGLIVIGLAHVGLSVAVRLEVRSATGKGLGVFATAPICAGAHVCNYVGEILSLHEVEERYGYTTPDYLLAVDASGTVFIDACHSEHCSRYINHAEDGNLVLSPPGGGGADFSIELRAARQIVPGEELTFDYGLGCWPCGKPLPRGAGQLALQHAQPPTHYTTPRSSSAAE